ncbi:MAG: hypothetical protein LC746_12175 [Acidobacteria bacterium]|nr:hypothetical protein [Acidobacteriota bacterium]
MKQVLRLPFFALALICLAASASLAQTATPTPDPFVAQLSSSNGDTFVRDISADGRFVVLESTGDIATAAPGQSADTKSPNNKDGNREIFLADVAQRRIFQITDTTSVLVDATKTGADRFASANVAVEISNNQPTLSRDGKWIAFTSNAFNPADPASSPFQFYGDQAAASVVTAIKADANQELFIYRVPDAAAADLTSGDLPAYTDLRQNAFTRATNTPASTLPRAGTTTTAPFVADDNRDPQINDDGSRVAFVSSRNLATTNGKTNADASPEVYVYNNTGSGSFTQITVTSLDQNLFVFTSNPNISGTGVGDSLIAFVSNATDLRAVDANTNHASGNSDGDSEVFVATYNGTNVTAVRQATHTKRKVAADTVNFFNPGRRMSRDGNLIAFESVAANPKADDSSTNDPNRAVFVYNVASDSFTQVGARAASDESEDVLRFPTFPASDNTRVVFASDLNFKSDGTRVAENDTTGLNPSRIKQIFTATVPAPSSTATTFTRLTNLTGNDPGNSMQPYVSNTVERIAFSLANFEFGTGNPDRANEAYYLVAPPAATGDTPAASSALQFQTGASRRAVVTPAASPTPTPSPTPSATPVTGLAPGMIGYVTTTSGSPATLANGTKSVCPSGISCDAASESQHRPPLPFELGGVSLSVNGAAAGLYFVSPNEIQFVVPPGLAALTGTATYPVVITIRSGAGVRTVRTVLQVVAAQPDLYTTTSTFGSNRAAVTNVTNPLLSTGTPEPFTVKTTYVDSNAQSVTAQTVLRLVLTGVRDPAVTPLGGLAASTFTVRITKSDNSTVDITGSSVPRAAQPTDTPGVFTLDFVLPDSLAAAGDVSVTVVVATGGGTFTSRTAADGAPKFRIN